MATLSRQREEHARSQARRAFLESELKRWLPLLIAHEQPDKIIFSLTSADELTVYQTVEVSL